MHLMNPAVRGPQWKRVVIMINTEVAEGSVLAHHWHQGSQHNVQLLANLQCDADHPGQIPLLSILLKAPGFAVLGHQATPCSPQPWDNSAPSCLPVGDCS